MLRKSPVCLDGETDPLKVRDGLGASRPESAHRASVPKVKRKERIAEQNSPACEGGNLDKLHGKPTFRVGLDCAIGIAHDNVPYYCEEYKPTLAICQPLAPNILTAPRSLFQPAHSTRQRGCW